MERLSGLGLGGREGSLVFTGEAALAAMGGVRVQDAAKTGLIELRSGNAESVLSNLEFSFGGFGNGFLAEGADNLAGDFVRKAALFALSQPLLG